MRTTPYTVKPYPNGDKNRVDFRFSERDMQQCLLNLREVENIEDLATLSHIKRVIEYYLKCGLFDLTKEYHRGDLKHVRTPNTIPLVFNHTAHMNLWHWVAALESKPEGFIEGSLNAYWLAMNGYKQLKNDCFACQYALEKTTTEKCICVNCPLEWGKHKYCLHPDGDTLHAKRDSAVVFSSEWSELSLLIATLPVKDGVKTI